MRHRSSRRKLSVDLEPLEHRQLLAADMILSPDMEVCTATPAVVVNALPADPRLAIVDEVAHNADEASTLVVEAPRQYIPGVPVLVRAARVGADGKVVRSTWDETVTLEASRGAATRDSIALVNGLGSTLMRFDSIEPFELTATLGEQAVTLPMQPLLNPAMQEVAGTLPGNETVWSGIVHVTADVTVPAGHTLTIEEGTTIVVDGLPQGRTETLAPLIRVNGTLRAMGTATAPINLTAIDPDQPWGELHAAGGSIELNYTSLTRAGNADRGGHTNTGPALRMTGNGSLTLNHSNISNISGKILQSTSGELRMIDSLLTRAVMGPEIDGTELEFRDSWIIDMAGRFHHNGTVDDNDGIYLHDQSAGQTIELIDSVVAGVQDDAIDTLGSDVLVMNTIVRDATDKGISVFGGETTVVHSLFVNTDIGIETKGNNGATATTNISNSTIANVGRAIRARNNNSPNAIINYNIVNSILHVRAGGDAIFTDYDAANLKVNYSWANEPWTAAGSGQGNLVGEPEFLDLANNDYRLPPASPAINAGDPTTPLDPDGSIADLGYLPSAAIPSGPLGDFDRDGDRDSDDLDLICRTVRSGVYNAALDINQDGVVSATDMVIALTSPDGFATVRGDANLDRVFDTKDLVQVFQVGLYEDGLPGNGIWGNGDWNCDGDFTSADLVAAFQDGGYAG